MKSVESKLARNTEVRRFASFAVTGGVAAVCNVVSRMLLSRVTGYGVAIAIAYLVGMLVAFGLARALVFEASEQPVHTELARFTTVNIMSFAQVWLVSVGLVRLVFPWLGFHWHMETVAHMIGVASPLIFSYYAHKHFTFRPVATNTGSTAGTARVDGPVSRAREGSILMEQPDDKV